MTKKNIFVTTIMLIAAILVFLVPRPRYESPDVLATLTIPFELEDWKSRDVAGTVDIRDPRYAFISEMFGREYVSRFGERLSFFIVDAGNFHHPKVCYRGSGFEPEDMKPAVLTVGDTTLEASTLFMKKDEGSVVLVYWMCIDGTIVNWTQQKMLEIWHAITGKEKVGLMMRFDVSVSHNDPDRAIKTVQQFVKDMSRALSPHDKALLFGVQK